MDLYELGTGGCPEFTQTVNMRSEHTSGIFSISSMKP